MQAIIYYIDLTECVKCYNISNFSSVNRWKKIQSLELHDVAAMLGQESPCLTLDPTPLLKNLACCFFFYSEKMLFSKLPVS